MSRFVFHYSRPGGTRAVPYGQTDRSMVKPLFVTRFPNALKILFRRHPLHLRFNSSEHAVQNIWGF